MALNNKVYNVLKWIALILLPAISTLIMAVGDIWGIQYKEQISLTIAAVDTFIGVLIGISTVSYKGEGKITIDNQTDECVVMFNEENALVKAQEAGIITLSVETVNSIQNSDTTSK